MIIRVYNWVTKVLQEVMDTCHAAFEFWPTNSLINPQSVVVLVNAEVTHRADRNVVHFVQQLCVPQQRLRALLQNRRPQVLIARDQVAQHLARLPVHARLLRVRAHRVEYLVNQPLQRVRLLAVLRLPQQQRGEEAENLRQCLLCSRVRLF